MANLRLYYKSDYKIRETFKTQAGEIIDPREYNFSFTFIAGKENTYTCSHTINGGENEWVNCKYDEENNAVLCVLDNHGLLPGLLKRELTIEEPDSSFPDNKLDYITFKAYEIELIDTTDGDTLYDIIDEEVIISGTTVTPAQLATIIHDSTEKETINDNDEVPYLDSETEYGIVKTTWLNIKAKLKTYFDTLFEPKKAATDLYVTQAEKSTWNAKQDALSADVDYLTPTTASTTYEPKKGENDNYVTDDEKTVIENTSGENTGDETAESIIDKIGTDGQIKSDYLMNILEPVQVTYAELYALKQSNNLTPYQVYEITDYATTYKIEADILTGSVEPLLVTAKSANELHTEAKSKTYPQDTVFYNIENSLNSLKGRIYRRIDNEKNIDVDIDFKAVKVRRWQTTANAWSSEINYVYGDIVLYNGSFYLSLKNNNLDNITSKYWAKLNLPNLSYASISSDGLVLYAVAGGTPNYGFISTGLKEDLQIFGDYENSYNIKITEFNNTIFHSSVRNFECNKLNDSYFYGSIDGFKIINDYPIQFVFFGNHIKNSVSLDSYMNIYNGDIINSTINNAQGFTSDLVDATFIAANAIVNFFTGLVKNVTFKEATYFTSNFIYGKFTNVYAESASEFNANVFYNDVDNVIFKGDFNANTINAKLSNITFDGNIVSLTLPDGEINGGLVKGTIGGYFNPVDLSSLVLPNVPCRMDTIDSTPLTFKFTYLNDVGRTAYMIVGLDASVIETGVYETETNKEADIETYKESSTKYPTLKGLYDWAVAKFLLATKLVTSWSGTLSHENIPSEKLVKDSLNLKADITPANGSTSALRALFTSVPNANCVYNTATGYYEMNGITDLTEAQLRAAYQIVISTFDFRGLMRGINIRTNFPVQVLSYEDIRLNLSLFMVGSGLEVFAFRTHPSFGNKVYVSSLSTSFRFCNYLKKIIGVLDVSQVTTFYSSFYSLPVFEQIELLGLKANIEFLVSPLLNLYTLQYMVTNRANGTKRITITVHATVWSKLNDAVNYPDWNALLVDAVANQYIDFASA